MGLTRRQFAAAAFGGGILSGAGDLRVDAGRLRTQIENLSLQGRPPGGTFADGVTRLGYSDADLAGRALLMRLIAMARATPRIDAAGNLFARRDGSDNSLAPVLFGSHIDSVPNGGNFDGDLGSLAAIEILHLLEQKKITTRRPLEAVVWACEEATFAGRSLNGSRAAAGKLEPGEMEHVSSGMKKSEAIRRIGGNPERITEARIAPGSYHAYLELHIEQGGTLEKEKVPIGVVDGIVSIDRWEAEVEGFANHAGTTPMAQRQDALVAASQLVLAVREIVTSEPGPQVGTVGHFEVHPNAPNVIPGRVRHSIELRDLNPDKLSLIAERIGRRAAAIASSTGTRISLKKTVHHQPAMASPEIQSVIESSAKALSLPFIHLPSGAGHDAQMMAELFPMGMIFVPSAGGISHSPREFTDWEDCSRGANVLLGAVLRLAA
jgi:N-carbamoyl-L-amino-acid hydrolase